MKTELPPDLDPLVTAHPASSAYRITGRLEGQAWTYEEQCAMAAAVVALDRERRELRELLNTPEVEDFLRGVPREAGHQRARWGEQHDKSKSGNDWMFLFGLLTGKAVQAMTSGEYDKAKHHAITAAAALANFHRLARGHAHPIAKSPV